MIVYLTHPKHGVHVAYSDDEVARCKANGWSVRVDAPKPPPEPPAPAQAAPAPQVPMPLPPRLPKLTVTRRKDES